MSCNHCNTKFNFFHKEIGCSNCGLSFCNKCLKQKCKIPDRGPNDFHVCKKCYSKLTLGKSSEKPPPTPPPDIFIRRLENLENPARPPITFYKQDQQQGLHTGLSPQDLKILDRLEKLKGDYKAPPTEAELHRRLASLKGENEYVEGPSHKTQLPPLDTRTDQEKADSLLEQFIVERDIKFNKDPQEEIEARLATLREKGVRPNEGTYISNLHDSSGSEEDEVNKITKKIMDEVALDDKNSTTKTNDDDDDDDEMEEFKSLSPELPWCILCNNDAKFRCLDCNGDLYCAQCNVEVHKTWDETDHKVVPYKSK